MSAKDILRHAIFSCNRQDETEIECVTKRVAQSARY